MRVVDLTKPIYAGMEVYPGDPQVRISIDHSFGTHGWLLRRLTLGSHTGTHVDACSHMDPDGPNLSELPVSRFVGPAWVTEKGREHPRQVGLLYLDEIGLEELEAILAAEPPFVGASMDEKLERALLQRGIITYTGLVNLNELPRDRSFTFVGLPLPIAEGDGSPVRAVAILEEES